MKDEARRWGVDERIRFNVECVAAEWSDATSLWTVTFLNLVTGEEFSRRCCVLVSCIGIFREGKQLDVPGIYPLFQWPASTILNPVV
jgi:cation diffusion facilitator CzcD-associated flavoprotein CzcO